jgi:hypothetical protein
LTNFKSLFGEDYIKVKLSLLWLFVMLNYIYADILTLMDASVLSELLAGSVSGGPEITPTFLLMGAVLMEIPIAMVFLSLMLQRRANRWANIAAGVIKTVAVAATAFVGTPVLYYLFFVVIEVATTLYIIWLAWTWTAEH